jgi:apolipoprotein D and lipocalin family protein
VTPSTTLSQSIDTRTIFVAKSTSTAVTLTPLSLFISFVVTLSAHPSHIIPSTFSSTTTGSLDADAATDAGVALGVAALRGDRVARRLDAAGVEGVEGVDVDVDVDVAFEHDIAPVRGVTPRRIKSVARAAIARSFLRETNRPNARIVTRERVRRHRSRASMNTKRASRTIVCLVLGIFLDALGGARAQATRARQRAPETACAPIAPVQPFNLTEYVDREWYVVAQKPTSYQPRRDLFCVRANYTLVDAQTISIWNTARRDGVSGRDRNARGLFKLRGIVEDVETPSKLVVGLNFLPSFTYGPYWVVATDTTPESDEFAERGYSWAIISGGPLTTPRGDEGLCEPSGGLWLFVRDPLVSKNVVDQIKATARELGIDTSVLLPVDQEGCTYPR